MKKILALLLAAALLFSFAACGKDKEEPAEKAPSTTDEFDLFEAEFEDTADETEATPDATDADASTPDASVESTEAAAPVPATVEEILAVYNTAINSAYDAKAGFEKERSTDNEKIEGGGVVFSAAKDLIYKFMGVGADNKYTTEVTKGNWNSDSKEHYLRKSTLTEADITDASCRENDGRYLIVLNVKGGTSRGSESEKFTKAPIDKCGICVGNEDKGYYDHKTGEVIYDALAGTYAAADIKESYDNAKISAIVDAETGKIVSLKVEFDIDVDIDIKVTSGTATATTHIYYKNFDY